MIEGADRFLEYRADRGPLESGTHLTELTLENVTFTDLATPSVVSASAEEPLTIRLKNVSASFREGAEPIGLFDGKDPNTTITVE